MRKPIPPRSKGKQRKVDLSFWLYKVITKTGWTYKEVLECPIPLFWLLIDEIQKEEQNGMK